MRVPQEHHRRTKEHRAAAQPDASPEAQDAPGGIEALSELALEAEAAVARLRQSLTALPQRSLTVGGEQTVTAEGLQGLLTQAAVSGPVLEMRPGTGVRPEPLKRLDEFESELLDRGVEVHTLCQHVTRFDPDLREELRLREEQGGLVRTMDTLPGWFLVIGDALALVPPPQGDDGTDTGAAGLVRDPTVVGVLRAVFTDYWLRARPFSQGRWRGAQIEGVSQEVNAVIIRMLCTGAKDELVAKRLGMSVRTLRRRIADMLGGLGAASRFQAGFEIGRSLGDQAICDAERRLEDNFGIAG